MQWTLRVVVGAAAAGGGGVGGVEATDVTVCTVQTSTRVLRQCCISEWSQV